MKILYYKKIKKISKIYFKIKKILNFEKVIKNNIIYKKITNEYKKLNDINFLFLNWIQNRKKKNILYNIKIKEIEKKILIYLIKEKKKNNNCFIEIKAGTGGNEASLFTKKLFKMYYYYSEIKNWKTKIIYINQSEYKGYKEIIFTINGKNVYNNLKFESGGHRVQRIPKTETQGRIHTSTCTIAILPKIKKKHYKNIDLSNIKIDTFKSSGAGGQHVNTTDSAVRITHIPTNIVVECQNERSQHKNKSKALEVLFARIKKIELLKQNKKNSLIKKNLLGSGDRTDRKRTYNFQKNRITDHRINLTLYCLEEIINGNIDILISLLKKKYNLNKLYFFLKNILF
ncbi:MAG: PCRF domain-containing protein [Enterobacteriaceae bacterium PSpyr]|nr:MAG: PCRF domain-containing protein [Enterobacteriaceae bacterium PSpyr]